MITNINFPIKTIASSMQAANFMMEVEDHPLENNIAQIKSAKEFLLLEYQDPNTIEPLKQYIKQALAKEVEDIVTFFKSQNDQLFLGEKKKHVVKDFAELPKNYFMIQEQSRKLLPTPSKKDLEAFCIFFSKPCCKTLSCTTKISFNDALECFKTFIGLSSAEKDFYIYGQLQAFARQSKSHTKNDGIVFDFRIGVQVL